MVSLDLSGKVAVVTGAPGELGRVITRTLAAAGANVAIHYYDNADQARALQADIAAKSPAVKSMIVQADITDLSSVFAMRDAVKKQLGAADIIVNNAILKCLWKHVLDQDPQDYENYFRTCVMHNVFMAKAFVPDMIAKRFGRVIGINTECTMQVTPTQSAYASGKGGMDRVLRVLAKEVGEHQITVNQVAPGWIISDKFRGTPAERQPEYEKTVPLRRRGYDVDVANAVLFFASPLADFISGAYLSVSGGNVMPCV